MGCTPLRLGYMKTDIIRLLLVEDDPQLAALTQEYLQKQGFSVDIQENGLRAVEVIRCAPPDLVILDVMLPGLDGFGVCKQVRGFSSIPIIMLTALGEDIDELQGLENGADDYISKPFSPREVVARVKAVLRRCMIQSHGEGIIQLGAIGIDLEARTVMLNDTLLNLTPAEYNLLVQLAGKPGKVFTRSELLQATQGACYAGYERTIDVHIKNLRQKIRQTDPDTIYIQTVTGQGYRALG